MPSGKKKDCKLNKIITFVYSTIMDFPDNKFEIKTVVTKFFLSMPEIWLMEVTSYIINMLPEKQLAMYATLAIKR